MTGGGGGGVSSCGGPSGRWSVVVGLELDEPKHPEHAKAGKWTYNIATCLSHIIIIIYTLTHLILPSIFIHILQVAFHIHFFSQVASSCSSRKKELISYRGHPLLPQFFCCYGSTILCTFPTKEDN